jgi:hypothetical protein
MSEPAGAQRHGRTHAEAFCLMQYECKPRESRFGAEPRPGCGTVEWIWNSRDGVTPFGVDCRACGGEALHARWGEDQYAPGHMPPIGSRMFVDLTEERAKQLAAATARRYWDTYPPSREQFATVDDLAAMLAREYGADLASGQPDLVVVAG